MLMQFDVLTFQVPDISVATEFYVNVLGMSPQGDKLIGFSADGLKLKFVKCGTALRATSRDAYGKIVITLRNLDDAVAYLKSENISCSDPSQFLNIGYFVHLHDPAGLGIELLQQGFEGHHLPSDTGHAIGSQATVAHISIRVSNLEIAKKWCEEKMRMRLMSIQTVDLYGFTLYFYGWSDEEIPGELESVEIREWLWARPYALLELQHIKGSSFLRQTPPGAAGLTTISCRGDEEIEIDCFADLRF